MPDIRAGGADGIPFRDMFRAALVPRPSMRYEQIMPTADEKELELKLVCPPGAASLTALEAKLGSPASVIRLRSIYFDTRDQILRANGWSLRIRTGDDGSRVQTIKAGRTAQAGLFDRHEWEKPVAGDSPEIEPGSPVDALLGPAGAALRPMFTVDVLRRKWMVTHGKAEIEAVFDEAVVTAGSRETSFSEIELERVRGKGSALFACAREIDKTVPLHLGVQSKAERGWRLRDHKAGATKADHILLVPTMTATEACSAIMHSCVRHFRINEELLLATGSAETVHQARVALRRLRSALVLFRPILRRALRQRINDDLRWMAGLLGEVRNLDVLLPDLDSKRRRSVQRERKRALGVVVEALASPRARGALFDLVQALSDGSLFRKSADDRPLTRLSAEALGTLDRQLPPTPEELRALDDADRHEVRKAAKRLRYVVEFLSSLYDGGKLRKRRIRYLAALEILQDRLGELNDLTERPVLLQRLGLESGNPPHDRDHLLGGAGDALAQIRDSGTFWD